MSLIFPIVCISFTLGSLFSGLLFRFTNRHLSCVVSVLLLGASVALTALSPNIAFMFSMAVIKGLTSGVFNTAQVVWIVELWEERSGPFLQALQFFISIGSFITPLMNKPFLNHCLQNSDNKTQLSIELFGNFSRNFKNYCENTTHIVIPFGIEGVLGLCGSVLLLIMFILMKFNKKSKNFSSTPNVNKCCEKIKSELTFFNKDELLKYQLFYIVCGFFVIGICFGSELANFQLLATFTRYFNKEISGENLTYPFAKIYCFGSHGPFYNCVKLSMIITLKY